MVKMSEAAEGSAKYPPGQHPNSRANLQRHAFKPGQSGNPGRVPAGPMITPALRRFAGLTSTQFFAMDLYSGCTMAELVAASLLTRAIQTDGDKARQEVIQRLDGALAPPTLPEGMMREVLIREYSIRPEELE